VTSKRFAEKQWKQERRKRKQNQSPFPPRSLLPIVSTLERCRSRMLGELEEEGRKKDEEPPKVLL
jgi:hypothetical protein